MADLEFARRLNQACEDCPKVPPKGRGQLLWLHRQMGVSNESVRKWLTGAARPRPHIMKELALALEVDEAWLSLGTVPSGTARERRARNIRATGASNVFMGLLQLHGATVALPEEDDPHRKVVDFYAIIRGRHRPFCVSQGEIREDGSVRMSTLRSDAGRLVICVVQRSEFELDYVIVPTKALEKEGRPNGDYIDVVLHEKGGEFLIGSAECTHIRKFETLFSYKED